MDSGKPRKPGDGNKRQLPKLPPLLLGQTVLEMVRSVDLDAVVRHRPEAVAGLRESVANLAAILGDTPTHPQQLTPATAAVLPPPATETSLANEPMAQGQSALVNALGGATFARRLAHVFVTRADPQVQPLKMLPGVNGLPMFHACIAPMWSPVDGAHGIFVASGNVFSAVYPYPFSSNRWYVRQTYPFETREELLEVIQQLMPAPPVAV